MLSFLLVKIVAAIFAFYCSGRVGREKTFVPTRVSYSQKEGEGRGGALNIIIRQSIKCFKMLAVTNAAPILC